METRMAWMTVGDAYFVLEMLPVIAEEEKESELVDGAVCSSSSRRNDSVTFLFACFPKK